MWVWLPSAVTPVVAGRLVPDGGQLIFNYGRSYLDRDNAIPLYLPELPIKAGAIPPMPGLTIAGCIRDAAPDAWGRRVILNHRYGKEARDMDTARLDELSYLLESGSDRIGGLDFQASATDYSPRIAQQATLAELLDAAAKVEAGIPLTPELDNALHHGSSLGGARPKAMIEAGQHKWIAKFSSSADTYSIVKSEYIAMRLAALAGLDAAPVRLERSAGKDVLLVRRFDRERTPDGYRRRIIVSALTMLGLDEMMARYASYEDLAEIVRHRFNQPKATLRELYGRLVFNVLCGNTDDHARNHAAFWDGETLVLTPAYDICPQARTGNEAGQAMLIAGQRRDSNLSLCLKASTHFLLNEKEAIALINHQLDTVHEHFESVCDEAALSAVDRNLLQRRQFLNPSIFDGSPAALQPRAF
ncbi:HipA domain-containing protein [Pseudoxanthomonas sp. CF125]|uniref:type II toxin-antitoxin system HipA family toxin n=1 Tax=Pseudoxanthomonas sp. CF125 TaxID=1855303 RepID=UPI001C40927C|nr:HipA domain-containing protein [Pseudoxanthomonas sp. CF125]